MSIEAFTSTIQSKVYKDWIAKLDKNIITSTVDSMRASEQIAGKTDFYITSKTVKDIFKTITGNTIEDFEAKVFLDQLAAGSDKTSEIKVNGSRAIKFTNIGFDTISTKLKQLLDEHDDIQMAYMDARDEFERVEKAALAQDKSISSAERKKQFNDIERRAKLIGFGTYFNKGHVISIATNATKRFRDSIEQASTLSDKQRKSLISVVEKYITKLQEDDLASANLPSSVSQELYASYIKNSDKYLVEIQCSVKNQESGRSSIAPVEELRKIFSIDSKDIEDIVKNSPSLGKALAETPGSPSYIDLLVSKLASVYSNTSANNKTYTTPKTLVGKKISRIEKPKKNTEKISSAKKVLSKLKTPSTSKNKFVEEVNKKTSINLTSLQMLINTHLQDVISANMGNGNDKRILNYRTGRFAASAAVERMSESRDGMITAFYTYMQNPYATFSEGGRQQYPKTRDPKLLIGKSIKEIAATQVGNRLRAVLV